MRKLESFRNGDGDHHGNGHGQPRRIDTVSPIAPPATGKGTLIKYLREELRISGVESKHMEVGDLVRQEIRSGSDMGRKIREYSNNGQLVPDQIINPMVRRGFEDLDHDAIWFPDGYPRSEEQIAPFEEMMDEFRRLFVILNMELDPDPKIRRQILMDRMDQRVQEAIAAGITPRKDDVDPVAREKRLAEAEQLADVTAYFQQKNRVITIDAMQDVPDVQEQTRRLLLPYLQTPAAIPVREAAVYR